MSMAAAMLFAQPWRIPAAFLAEQHEFRGPTRSARGLYHHGPVPVRRHRPTPDPARHHRAHPRRLGRMRPSAARPPRVRGGRPAAPRAAGDDPRLRAPAPHRTARSTSCSTCSSALDDAGAMNIDRGHRSVRRTDGVVPWQACLEFPAPTGEGHRGDRQPPRAGHNRRRPESPPTASCTPTVPGPYLH